MTDVAGGEDPWRRHLHAAVDYILDGPGSGDMDEWATQALASLGHFIRAAWLALDYEADRIRAGFDRRRGIFPVYPLWQGASIPVEKSTADAWCQAGGEARDATMSPETVQRVLAAILHPIANTSCDVWLCHLADALDALQHGERPDLLKPCSRRRLGNGKGRTAYRLRLGALAWAEFQEAAGRKKKTQAIQDIAIEFGRDRSSVRDWREATQKEFGPALVNEEIQRARNYGLQYLSIQNRTSSGIALDDASTRLKGYFEETFSPETLKSLAEEYRRLGRKKTGKGSAAPKRKRT